MGGSLISYLACILLSLAAGIAIAFPLGIQYRKKVAEAELGTAEEEAKRIVGDAIKDAEVKKKEALVEAKDEIHKQRTEAEKEVKERRNEVQRLERRVQQKEESVDRKLDNLEKKEETLQNKIKEAESKLKEAAEIKANQFEVLEKISGYTAEECKEVREQHRAGIPCLVIDNDVILVEGPEHMKQLIDQYQLKAE